MKTTLIIFTIVAICLSGCANFKITAPDGTNFESLTAFKNFDVNDITIEKLDGTKVHVKGASVTSNYIDSIAAAFFAALIAILGA